MNNSGIILAGGIYLYYSLDSGKHFRKIQGNIHADFRSLYFIDNQDFTKFYTSTDGGAYYTKNLGRNWTNLSNFCVLSIFDFSVENSTNPAIIMGLQDNGTLLKEKKGQWKHILGGDGGCALLDDSLKLMFAQVNRYYYCANSQKWQSCGIRATYIGGAEIAKSSIFNDVFFIPTFSKKLQKSVLIKYSSKNKSKQNIFNEWGLISAIATRKQDVESEEIVVAVNNRWSSYLQISKIFYKNNQYLSQKIFKDSSIAYEKVLSIDFDYKNGIFLAFDGYNPERKVLYSTDDGNSWINLTYNLPNVPVFKVLFVKKFNLLLIGNMYGIYKLADNHWERIESLPYMAVTDMQFIEKTDALYIATYGRGIWKCMIKKSPAGLSGE